MELLIDNRNGNVWDLTSIVSSISWRTSRIGKPSSLEFTLLKDGLNQDKALQFNNGDVIRFTYKKYKVFYGYVFTVSSEKGGVVRLTAYDQLRYLLSNETFVRSNITATQVIRQIADDLGLRVGSLANTQYRIPTLVEDNQKLLDIICKALDLTLIATTQNYVLYDDFGSLTLRNINTMALDFVIGDRSLLYDYEYSRSIDKDTYNRVKIVRNNKETGRRDVYIAQDSSNIAKWGRLQLFHTADENMNAAQINELLGQLIRLKNREQKSLKLRSVGDIRVRAGCFLPVTLDDEKMNQYYLVDECTHTFEGSNHTMSIDVKVIG